VEPLSSSDTGNTRVVLPVSWVEIDALTHLLAAQILAQGRPEVIIGMQRGGLIPAVMLSHQLHISSFISLPVRRTTSDRLYATKHAPLIEQQHLLSTVAGKDVLIVDDVIGTGASIAAVLALLPLFTPSRIRSLSYFVNLDHWMSTSGEKLTNSITYIGQQVHGWIIFPWEAYHEQTRGTLSEQPHIAS
jgi:uncharacterized protein